MEPLEIVNPATKSQMSDFLRKWQPNIRDSAEVGVKSKTCGIHFTVKFKILPRASHKNIMSVFCTLMHGQLSFMNIIQIAPWKGKGCA